MQTVRSTVVKKIQKKKIKIRYVGHNVHVRHDSGKSVLLRE